MIFILPTHFFPPYFSFYGPTIISYFLFKTLYYTSRPPTPHIEPPTGNITLLQRVASIRRLVRTFFGLFTKYIALDFESPWYLFFGAASSPPWPKIRYTRSDNTDGASHITYMWPKFDAEDCDGDQFGHALALVPSRGDG
jgi:hypothetical protein